MKSEIEQKVDFQIIRYAMCWEDADLLLTALALQKNDIVLSIASAGDNSFAMLTKDVQKVYAIDLSQSQLACCQLRKVAYSVLSYEEFISFANVLASENTIFPTLHNITVYQEKLRPLLDKATQDFWDQHLEYIEKGYMNIGKFENYFALFREKILPLIHSKMRINELVSAKHPIQRLTFYENTWNNLRWKMLFSIFFSRFFMGRLGRDKKFFTYVEGSVSNKILARVKHALTELEPKNNPYLHYILYGKFLSENALPLALRREHFQTIKENLSKIEFINSPIESFINALDTPINAFNLSDIFEYMSEDNTDLLYTNLLKKSAHNARFAYWNMLAPRTASPRLRERYNLQTNVEKNKQYLNQDKAFFYSQFYLDWRE